ncbi:helix-turn-helix transcriptional regulator [Gaoshiqia sp. Z1-71]|uniref:helix-turn-helix transcriptional regulator n=1 Tax=Gaoshiqia hydrogeniformans TaxID=3290090 RepID=UPI003BF8C1FC
MLKLILFLSNSYPKTKEECVTILGIKDSAFYNYRNDLIEIGFNLIQKDGKYWIEHQKDDHQVLQNILHFTEEESWLLSRTIDLLDAPAGSIAALKRKLTQFLNQDKALESYLQKEKSVKVQTLANAMSGKKQTLLINYASGNSQTVKNRLVEPFEFKDDFNLVWAFDTGLKQNRQFKICRIEDIQVSPLNWEYARSHRSMPVDIFRNTGELNKQVELILTLKARNLLIEEYPLADRFLEKHSTNKYILKAPVAKYEGPGRFALGLAEDVQAIGDNGFREYLKTKIKKTQNLFPDSTNSGVTNTIFDQN